ncbi:hypothetical protein Tco_0402125 [Tanacetum coccineum]
MGDKNPIGTLRTTPNLATRATGIPSSSPSFKESYSKNSLNHGNRPLASSQNFFMTYVIASTRRSIDQSGGGKLRDLNAEESWALLEDLGLYDNESWNDPRDFRYAQVKDNRFFCPYDISLSTSPSRLSNLSLENQVHIA